MPKIAQKCSCFTFTDASKVTRRNFTHEATYEVRAGASAASGKRGADEASDVYAASSVSGITARWASKASQYRRGDCTKSCINPTMYYFVQLIH